MRPGAEAGRDGRGAVAWLEAAWREGGPRQWMLRPLGLLHRALVALRRAAYRLGLRRVARLDVPVVVVGNRVAGGAGKTPVTIALVQALREAGRRPGIVSRGHGGRAVAPLEVGPDTAAGQAGDEPVLMRRRTGVPVVVGRDRVAAARALRRLHPDIDVIVCDDGLQHLRLGRDVEIVVLDERGGGNGWLLPAGPLREPLDAPPAAPCQLVLHNTDHPAAPLAGGRTRRHLAGAVPLARWWAGEAATPGALAALQGRPVLASAGVGQPARFFDALRAAGLTVRPQPLDDHHDHARLPWPADAREVLVTEKDAIKLDPARIARERPDVAVWVVPLALALPEGFVAQVLDALRATHPAHRPAHSG